VDPTPEKPPFEVQSISDECNFIPVTDLALVGVLLTQSKEPVPLTISQKNQIRLLAATVLDKNCLPRHQDYDLIQQSRLGA
jgi:hypothetical protein